MIRIRGSDTRGHFRNHWLDARFSFSFGAYRDPAFDGCSDLLVLTDDVVAPSGGFAMHPHADVEVFAEAEDELSLVPADGPPAEALLFDLR